MIKIKFTDLERWAMWEMARLREEAKTRHARDKRNDKKIPNIEMHYIGIKGEYGASRYLGVPFDMDALVAGRDADLHYRAHTVEVKVLQKWLVITPGDLKCDLIVLANPDRRSLPDRRVSKRAHAYQDIWLMGWIDRASFERDHFTHNFGYGMRQCLRPNQLRQMGDLLNGGLS